MILFEKTEFIAPKRVMTLEPDQTTKLLVQITTTLKDLQKHIQKLNKRLQKNKKTLHTQIERIIKTQADEIIIIRTSQMEQYFTERIKYVCEDVKDRESKERMKCLQKYVNVLESLKVLEDEKNELYVKKEYYKKKLEKK